MNPINIKIAKDYLDENLSIKELRKESGIKSRKVIFEKIISVISLSTELNIGEKKACIEKLKTRIQQCNSDKLTPLLRRIEELTLILQENIHSNLKKLDSEYNKEIKLENRHVKSAFTTMFTHFILNSVSKKLNYRTDGSPIDLSIKLIRDSLRSYVKDKTLLNNLEDALKDAFQINIVSDDHNIYETKYYENHRGLLTFLINKMMVGIKPEFQGRPYTFIAAPNLTHNIFLKIAYSKPDKKFTVQLINTGKGSKSIGNGRVRDIIYKGVRESDLKLLVDFFLQQKENFSFHKWLLEKTLKSKSVSTELGFKHKYQQGDSCVIKSLMSCINQSFLDRLSYKGFKCHLTKTLIDTMKAALKSNSINEQHDPKIREKLENATVILNKRNLKREILEIEHLLIENEKELGIINQVIEICELAILKNLKRTEEFKSEIDDLKSKIIELNNALEAKKLTIDKHKTNLQLKKIELKEILENF